MTALRIHRPAAVVPPQREAFARRVVRAQDAIADVAADRLAALALGWCALAAEGREDRTDCLALVMAALLALRDAPPAVDPAALLAWDDALNERYKAAVKELILENGRNCRAAYRRGQQSMLREFGREPQGVRI